MSVFCCPAGFVTAPDINSDWQYFRGAEDIPFIVERETYIETGRIGEDGNYAGPVGFWGFGASAVIMPDYREWHLLAYDWHTRPEPNYEPLGILHVYSDAGYPVVGHYSLSLHTAGYTQMAGVANDLWLFGDGIKPIQPFILPRGIVQMKIGANPV